MDIKCTKKTSTIINQLVNIWENSVKETHTFLKEDEILKIKEYVFTAIKEIPILLTIEENNEIIGFCGINEQKIEMLFIKYRNKGYGKQLVNYAIKKYNVNEVTVNEQNTNAFNFYKHLGFKVFKRSEVDEQGNNYPILYMKLIEGEIIEVNSLNDADINECLKIYNYYILNTCVTLEEKELTFNEFKKRCLKIQKNFPFIVYKDFNKKVIGYCYLNTFNERSAYRRSADLSIYVKNGNSHSHIGTLLLNKIITLAKDYKIDTIISIITSENKPSINFHEKYGFALQGNLKDVAFKFNKNISIYYYVKKIN